jgi:UDP-N-acetylmuramoylalanine--D-glutamate ligase
MQTLENKQVLVVGLGASGEAAALLLLAEHARVTVVDQGDTPGLRAKAAELRKLGAEVQLGARALERTDFALAVVSPGVPPAGPLVKPLDTANVPIVSELELGWQRSLCLSIAVTGTNGKTTTTELIAHLLKETQRKTIAAGNIGLPLCNVAAETRDLDFLTLEVSSFQLERIQFFRPAIAVLLNITPDHLDRYAGMADYARAKARVFENQQPFDWAIVQSEALAMLRAQGVKVPSKIITFSAVNQRADLYLDRTLLISRLSGWEGVLLDLEKTHLRGPHNAENFMAALAVGRVLRIPLEEMRAALSSYKPAAHRCELVAEVNGVKFVNDSKATNLDAVAKAVQTMPAAEGGKPNVWLIAGGRDKGFDFYEIGPLLSRRVKGAFLIGETREKLRAAWGLFTGCELVDSLPEAVRLAAQQAVPGDVVLLSPACASFDQFSNYSHRGEVFRQTVQEWARTATNGAAASRPPLPDDKTIAT